MVFFCSLFFDVSRLLFFCGLQCVLLFVVVAHLSCLFSLRVCDRSRCSLFVACCVLHVVCFLCVVSCLLLFVACCCSLFHVVGWLVVVGCLSLLLRICCDWLFVVCCVLRLARLLSLVLCCFFGR